MKTLKKSLCLILSVIMVVGVLAVSASAATFTDSEKIQYTEAVEVLSAINVIDGIGDGSFAPTATLTREQGAAIVVRALLTRSVSDLLSASTSNFSDVAVSSWSAGVIEYAAAHEIIVGYDGKFAPSDTLTGTQFAKMLLVALGIEGEYTGNFWATNVITASESIGLAEGISNFNYNTGITREQACQMAYNAIWHTEKETTTQYVVVNDAENPTVTYYDGPDAVTALLYAQMNEGEITTKTVSTGSIADVTYKLSKNERASDAFKRPVVTVEDASGKVDVKVSKSTPVLTYTTAVKSKTLYSALGLSKKASATVYVNGQLVTSNFQITGTSDTVVNNSGNGVTTEVYKNGKDSFTIVVIEPIYTTVKDVRTSTDPDTGKKVVTTRFNATYTTTDENEETVRNFYSFKTSDFKQRDHVIITVADGKVQSVELCDTVTGTLTQISTKNNASKYTIGGDVYEVSALAGAITLDSSNLAQKVSYYVDSCGYLLESVDPTQQTATYINILASAKPEQGAGNYLENSSNDYTGAVYGILSNGTYGEYTVNYTDSLAVNNGVVTSQTNPISAGVYTYTVNDDGDLVIGAEAETVPVADVKSGTSSVRGALFNSATTYVFYTKVSDTNATIKNFDVKTGYSNSGYISAGLAVIDPETLVASVVFVNEEFDEGATAADVVYVDSTVYTEGYIYSSGRTINTYTYTGYTSDGTKLSVTKNGSQIPASGLYNYNDDLTLGAAVSAANVAEGTVQAVYGSIILITDEDGTTRAYNYDSDTVAYLDEYDSAVAETQEVIGYVKNGVITQLWVLEDAVQAD